MWFGDINAQLKRAAALGNLKKSLLEYFEKMRIQSREQWLTNAEDFLRTDYSRERAREMSDFPIRRVHEQMPGLELCELEDVADFWLETLEFYFFEHRDEIPASRHWRVGQAFHAPKTLDRLLGGEADDH